MVNQFTIRDTWQRFGWGGQGSSPAALAAMRGHQCFLQVLSGSKCWGKQQYVPNPEDAGAEFQVM